MFPDQNPYHYCYNSPLIYSDPSGMAPELALLVGMNQNLYLFQTRQIEVTAERYNPQDGKPRLTNRQYIVYLPGSGGMGNQTPPMGFAQSMGLYYLAIGEAGYRASLGNNLPSLSIKSNSGGSGSGGTYYKSYKEKEIQKSELTNEEIGNIVAKGYVGNNNAYLYTIGITTTIPFVIPTIPVFLRAAIPAGLIVGGGTFFYILATSEKSNEINNPAN